jgi:5'-nucleotidase / UDP-sugar diphosphatase
VTRRASPFLVAVLAALSVLAAKTRAQDEPVEKRFTLLYTTDIHAHYLGKDDGKGGKKGGMAALAAKVAAIKEEVSHPVFLFDSGDVMTGHPISDLEYQGVTGGALYEMMNLVGYDAWCLGNHDFDHGRENVSKIVQLLKFPTLSANLAVEGEPAIALERWKVIEKNGVRLGVFGLMTENFAKVTGKDKVKGVTATKCVDAAREAVAALASHCDVIVALSHCGSSEDIKLADQVKGINVILSGHNHQPLKPAFHGDTIVAEGEVWSEKLGRMDLKWTKGKYDRPFIMESKLLPLEPAEAKGELKKVLDHVYEQVGKRLEEKLATIETPWKRNNRGESNIGGFFADGLKTFAKCDCAFLNSGGIRANHEGPDVTLGTVLEIFPFENSTVTFELSGADLWKACEKNATAQITNEYGVLQVGGVAYEWKRHGKKAEILKVTVNGEPLDKEKKYRCASLDFVAVDQSEKYLGPDVKVENVERLHVTMSKVAEEWVREQGKKGPIKATLEGRMAEQKK